MYGPGHLYHVGLVIFLIAKLFLDGGIVPTAGCHIARDVPMGIKPALRVKIHLNQSIPLVSMPVGLIMGARTVLPMFALNAEKVSITILQCVWLVQLQVVLSVLHNLVVNRVYLGIS